MTQREQLAQYAHEAWSGWMKYMFSLSKTNSDGTVTSPKSLVDRWQRQLSTQYVDLPVNEQNSDLAEATKMVNIFFSG